MWCEGTPLSSVLTAYILCKLMILYMSWMHCHHSFVMHIVQQRSICMIVFYIVVLSYLSSPLPSPPFYHAAMPSHSLQYTLLRSMVQLCLDSVRYPPRCGRNMRSM